MKRQKKCSDDVKLYESNSGMYFFPGETENLQKKEEKEYIIVGSARTLSGGNGGGGGFGVAAAGGNGTGCTAGTRPQPHLPASYERYP